MDRLPANPQVARLAFTPVAPMCQNAPPASVKAGTFRQTPWGELVLIVLGHVDYGSLAADGSFDLAGVDPFEHWHGSFTSTGGSAQFQTVITGMDCTQTYSVVIEFVGS